MVGGVPFSKLNLAGRGGGDVRERERERRGGGGERSEIAEERESEREGGKHADKHLFEVVLRKKMTKPIWQ